MTPGRHTIRCEFQKTDKEQYGAGGKVRLFVDGQRIGEGDVPRTAAFAYSLDETFDIGCDKGAPLTPEYKPLAEFTGRILEVRVDLRPDFTRDTEAKVTHAMVRQ